MYYYDTGTLFGDKESREMEQRWRAEIETEIKGQTDQYILAVDDDEFVTYFDNKYSKTLLDIDLDQKALKEENIRIDVTDEPLYNHWRDGQRHHIDGKRFHILIPFTGDEELWRIKPRNGYMHIFHGVILPREQQVSILVPYDVPAGSIKPENAEKIKYQIDHELELVRNMVNNVNQDVQRFNSSIENHVRNVLETRRASIGNRAAFLQTLGIPIHESDTAPNIKPITVRKKTIHLPKVNTTKERQYGIEQNDYESILKVIRHEGRSFEATPSGISKMDEEEIREFLVASLNGHFEGEAKGEVFRREGKTDIHIEFDNRAAFIAECKVWRGQKAIGDSIDQLFGYLTWRDCKVALIVFNKDKKGFSQLQEKMHEALSNHENCIREERIPEAGEWRFRFRSRDDDEREVIVHAFLFNFYVER